MSITKGGAESMLVLSRDFVLIVGHGHIYMNKIMRLGSMLFSIVLFAFSAIKYLSDQNRTGVYYLIAAVGFLIVYISYRKKEKGS